ncbi:TPA: GpE family phage tail protein [Escherichia coli]|nr:GpE family phage tail protein [Escherichia coli]
MRRYCPGQSGHRSSELYPMSLTELITWREKALRRSGNTNE